MKNLIKSYFEDRTVNKTNVKVVLSLLSLIIGIILYSALLAWVSNRSKILTAIMFALIPIIGLGAIIMDVCFPKKDQNISLF